MRLRLPIVLALSSLGSLGAQALPDVRTFHEHLWQVIDSYPVDGTHTYHWPKSGGWAGVTRDLSYQGEVVAEGDPEGRCFCCGLTFEVFFLAWQRWCEAEERAFRIGELEGRDGITALRRAWFGSDGNRRTLHNAIPAFGLGQVVDDFEDALPGDFVQLWRHSGSGHSVVFVDWVREDGAITGLRYWSTQKSTDGIGERTEMFGGKRGVDPEQLYIARVGVPSRALRFAVVALSPSRRVTASRLLRLERAAPDVIGLSGRRIPETDALRQQFDAHDVVVCDAQRALLVRRTRVQPTDDPIRFVDRRAGREFSIATTSTPASGWVGAAWLRVRADEWVAPLPIGKTMRDATFDLMPVESRLAPPEREPYDGDHGSPRPTSPEAPRRSR